MSFGPHGITNIVLIASERAQNSALRCASVLGMRKTNPRVRTTATSVSTITSIQIDGLGEFELVRPICSDGTTDPKEGVPNGKTSTSGNCFLLMASER